jgi:hypothetical protein
MPFSPITKIVQLGWLYHQGRFLGGIEFSHLKASTRWLFNKAKKTGDWEPYKMALTSYHKAIRKAKRSSWREHFRGFRMYLTEPA